MEAAEGAAAADTIVQHDDSRAPGHRLVVSPIGVQVCRDLPPDAPVGDPHRADPPERPVGDTGHPHRAVLREAAVTQTPEK